MSDKVDIIKQQDIESRIFTFRGFQVMIDRDLAEMYNVPTKALNQAAKRNQERFPSIFRFQLTDNEKNELVTNCDRFRSLKHTLSNPYAFTEQGVAMLSAVLHSETAVKVSIQIIQAFVEIRKFITENASVFYRLDKIERKQLDADEKFEKIFDALQSKESETKQGIFYDGQMFDAWKYISDLIRKAETSITLIDNYIDDSVLNLFTKRRKGVKVKIYTKTISEQLAHDLGKFNRQYEPIEIIEFKDAHDRFLMIDEKDLYHVGASLKDLGKKWFAFSKMEIGATEMLIKLKGKKE